MVAFLVWDLLLYNIRLYNHKWMWKEIVIWLTEKICGRSYGGPTFNKSVKKTWTTLCSVTHGINLCPASSFYLQFLTIHLLKLHSVSLFAWILHWLNWFIMLMCFSLCIHNKNQCFTLNIHHRKLSPCTLQMLFLKQLQ